MRTFFCSLLLILTLWVPLGKVGAEVKSERLAAIRTAMEAEIAAHRAAGVVTLVLQDGKLVHHDAAGFADLEQRVPMKTDSVFWIASMTKSISAVTILTLVDEGKLSLDESAEKWMKELGKVKLKNGEPPQRAITLRDLLSHTAGIAVPPRRPTDGAHSLQSSARELLQAPLAFEPGSNYEYGYGITIAGRIAEIVAEKPFETLVQERILDPLQMQDTTFHPDAELRLRIAKTYKTKENADGLTRAYNPYVTSEPNDRRMTEPSGGLFSTATDMARFYQMILDGGVFQGQRIISAKAIAEMTTAHQAGGKVLGYGLGWQCSSLARPAIPGFSERAFGHGGAFGTHGWIDPEQRVVTVFMVQNALVKQGGTTRTVFHQHVTNHQPEASN